jgi:hypothetical protein
MSFRERVEGQAWARLLAEKHDPEVSAVIGDAVKERSGAWCAMATRAVARGELPDGTDPRLLLGMLGAIVDAWSASSPGGLKSELLEAAVRTVVAGARSGSLVRSGGRRWTRRALPRSLVDRAQRRGHGTAFHYARADDSVGACR